MSSLDEENRIEGLVLSLQDYKDNDGLAKIATPEGIVTFYAKGVQKQGSKNRRIVLPASRVRLEYLPQYSGEFLYLMHGDLLASYQDRPWPMEVQAANAMTEFFLLQYGMSQDRYTVLEKAWQAFSSNRQQEGIAALAWLIKDVLKSEGIGMEVDCCTLCQARDSIAGISMESGGFVCNRHPGAFQPESRGFLQRMRALFRAPADCLDSLRQRFVYDWQDLAFLARWYSYQSGGTPRAMRFFLSLFPEES